MRRLICSLSILILIQLSGLYAGLPDTLISYSSEDQVSDKVERVLMHLHNVPAGSKVYPGSNGRIILERRKFRMEAPTLDAMAGFFNVPVNAGYTVSGFHQSQNEAFSHPLELWGIWKNLEINSQKNEFTFVRNMPYINDIQTSYNRTNEANPSLQKGEEMQFDIIMHNPTTEDFRAKVVLKLKNISTGQVFELDREVLLAAGSQREHASIKFTTTQAGEYHLAAGIFVKQHINQWTDCWDWSKNPLFFVTGEHRMLDFAGYHWDVKAGFGNPGSNLWSNDTTHVYTDNQGRLHLTLKKKENDRWYASEVISRETFNYGTYTFYIDADPANYDPHVVAGIFLYRDEVNEIDIEFSRWGDQNNYQFGNFVIQPADYPGNQFQFPILASGTYTTHRLVWKPDEVLFSSWHGHYPEPPDGRMIAQWQYAGKHVPKPNGLRLFFNIWLFRGIAPKTEKSEKLIIKDFTFTPLP